MDVAGDGECAAINSECNRTKVSSPNETDDDNMRMRRGINKGAAES
jgi:hypothetical protein